MAGVNGVAREEEEGPRRAKRKARKPAIKDESSEDSDTPLVSLFLLICIHGLEVSGGATRHPISRVGTLLTQFNY